MTRCEETWGGHTRVSCITTNQGTGRSWAKLGEAKRVLPEDPSSAPVWEHNLVYTLTLVVVVVGNTIRFTL